MIKKCEETLIRFVNCKMNLNLFPAWCFFENLRQKHFRNLIGVMIVGWALNYLFFHYIIELIWQLEHALILLRVEKKETSLIGFFCTCVGEKKILEYCLRRSAFQPFFAFTPHQGFWHRYRPRFVWSCLQRYPLKPILPPPPLACSCIFFVFIYFIYCSILSQNVKYILSLKFISCFLRFSYFLS